MRIYAKCSQFYGAKIWMDENGQWHAVFDRDFKPYDLQHLLDIDAGLEMLSRFDEHFPKTWQEALKKAGC